MIKKARYWIRNFFGFSRTETNGFLGLLLIIILFLFAPMVFEWSISSTYTTAASDKILLDSLTLQLNQQSEYLAYEEKKEEEEKAIQLNLFSFDPNEADLQTLLLLGLPEDIGQRIINYRKAGGSFEVKSDLSKIYGLPVETFESLYPYIQLPEKKQASINYHNKVKKNTFSKAGLSKPRTNERVKDFFDINTCDTVILKAVYGIGSVLAERVVKYRSLLGGFVQKEQLQEVYGLKEEALLNLYESSYIDSTFVPVRIKVNEKDVQEMAAHPYISYPLAKAIYAYRKQHGHYSAPEELLKIHILDSAIYEKLRPYIAL